MGHGNCQQDTTRASNQGMISKYLEKLLILAVFDAVSEVLQRGRRMFVTNRDLSQTMYRNQRLGVKTLHPESIRSSRICFEKVMGRPLLSSWFFFYCGNDSVSWGNERYCPVRWLSPRARCSIGHVQLKLLICSVFFETAQNDKLYWFSVTHGMFQLALTGKEIFHRDD